MNREHINVGDFAFDANADTLRDAMIKVNSNFTSLFDTAESLKGSVKQPLILKVTDTLPCRPDKNGLYLLDRKKSRFAYKQYREIYAIHFGRNNESQEGRLIGDDNATYSTNAVFGKKVIYTGDTELEINTSPLTIPSGSPLIFFNVYTLKNVYIQIKGYDNANNDIIDMDGVTNSQHGKLVYTSYKDYYNYQFGPETLNDGPFRFVFKLYDCDRYAGCTRISIRQWIDVPSHFEKHRYVLACWTGEQWTFIKSTIGIKIPIKDTMHEYVDGTVALRHIDWPRLISVRKNSVEKVVFEFDKPVPKTYKFIFSRYKSNSFSRRGEGDVIVKRNWDLKKYSSKKFRRFPDTHILTGSLRGKVPIKNYVVDNDIGFDEIRSRMIQIPVSEFKYNFFDNDGLILHSKIRKLIRKGPIDRPRYFPMGFQLCVNHAGETHYSPIQYFKIVFQVVNNAISSQINFKLWK